MNVPEWLKSWYEALPDTDASVVDESTGLRIRTVYTKHDADIDLLISRSAVPKEN